MQFGIIVDPKQRLYFNFVPENDLPIVLVSAVILFIIREICVRFVFPPLAKALGCKEERDFKKFYQNAYYALYYITFTSLGYLILWNESWIWQQYEIYSNFPHHDTDFISNPYLRPFYLCELGFYLQALFSHLFIDEKLKDFWVLFIHHITTIFLIAFSIVVGYHRIGAWLLLLHDMVDIFLYVGNMFSAAHWDGMATFCFVFFVSTYAYLRLFLLSGLVLYTIYIPFANSPIFYELLNQNFFFYSADAWQPFELTSRQTCVYNFCFNTTKSLVGGMMVLVFMHMYWFALILFMIYRMITTGTVSDVREDKKKVE